MRSEKDLNSPQAKNETTLHVHASVESLRILCQWDLMANAKNAKESLMKYTHFL